MKRIGEGNPGIYCTREPFFISFLKLRRSGLGISCYSLHRNILEIRLPIVQLPFPPLDVLLASSFKNGGFSKPFIVPDRRRVYRRSSRRPRRALERFLNDVAPTNSLIRCLCAFAFSCSLILNVTLDIKLCTST